jgi:2-polyprenyl-3-methyl-5-hydroxy-6-metoxy-1,4-benzoquinol methylase
MMDIRKYNQIAWDNKVKQGKRYTIPAGPEVIKQAKAGNWQVNLTPCIPVPREWFPPLEGLKILCLASGGGVQGPILAAAGADVTVFDNSPLMLETDRSVAVRDSLKIRTVEGDMADLGQFSNSCFDLIVHPVSNTFVPMCVLSGKKHTGFYAKAARCSQGSPIRRFISLTGNWRSAPANCM